MRFYPNLIKAVAQSLDRIFLKKEHAGTVVEQTLKSNKQWGSRDRRFIAESIYEIIRWYRLLYEIDGQEPKNEADWWRLFGILQLLNERQLPERKEFEGIDEGEVLKKFVGLNHKRSIATSIPEWLDELGVQEMGEELWTKTIFALNEDAELVLRPNTLKISQNELVKTLEKEGVEAHPISGEAIVLAKRRKLAGLKSFRKGLFEVQDKGSQEIAPFLEVEPGMTVIDACAGAGGKTLHLAALMNNEGRITAMDVHKRKLVELEKRIRRNDVKIVKTAVIKEAVVKGMHETADRLLLDVPCSGLGVLKRKPDSKWKLSFDEIQSLKKLQEEILSSYSKMVKVGGKLVYATCSVLPSENEEQVRKFIAQNGDRFVLLKEKNVRPQDGFDGFYMALIERIKN